jgi:hypothetical protein
MTFTQRRSRLTTYFSERIRVVKRRISELCWREILLYKTCNFEVLDYRDLDYEDY